MNPLKVTAERTKKWWILTATLDENTTIFSQCRRLDQIEATIRDTLALMPEYLHEIPIEIVYKLPAREKQIKQALSASQTAREASTKATSAMRSAVAVLREDGLSVRDIGVLLGVSAQRVSHIAKVAV